MTYYAGQVAEIIARQGGRILIRLDSGCLWITEEELS